jgi:hypothetical protein
MIRSLRGPCYRIGSLGVILSEAALEAEDVATVPERIAAFLKGHRQQPYCDGCLGKLLGLGSGANRYGSQCNLSTCADNGVPPTRRILLSLWEV